MLICLSGQTLFANLIRATINQCPDLILVGPLDPRPADGKIYLTGMTDHPAECKILVLILWMVLLELPALLGEDIEILAEDTTFAQEPKGGAPLVLLCEMGRAGKAGDYHSNPPASQSSSHHP